MIHVRLRLRHTGSGGTTLRTIAVRVPRSLHRGPRTLRLTGTPADSGTDPNQDGGDLSLAFEPDPTAADVPGPQSLTQLREDFEALGRYDGVTAHFGRSERYVLDDPRLRISGEAWVRLRIR
jgi:hypothetical protein